MVVLSEKEIRGVKIRRLIYAADAGELVLIKLNFAGIALI